MIIYTADDMLLTLTLTSSKFSSGYHPQRLIYSKDPQITKEQGIILYTY